MNFIFVSHRFHFLGPLVIAALSLCALISASMNSCTSTPTSCVPDTVLRHDTIRDTVHVLDTTSHAFTWYVDTLGDRPGSYFNDVWTFDQNNVWAVGTFDKKGEIDNYNLAHWDGAKWEIKRVKFYSSASNDTIDPPLLGIYAFSPTDIWLGAGGGMVHGDGTIWKSYHVQNDMHLDSVGGLSKSWGVSSHDIYFIGVQGSLIHYDGTSFKKIETGTRSTINDIWGVVDSAGNQQILCAATSPFGEHKLLRVNPSTLTVENLSWTPNHEIMSVWFKTTNKIYTAGDGVFVGKPGSWTEQPILPYNYSQRVRGPAYNDIFVVGAFGLCTHYNGHTWQTYPEAALPHGSYSCLFYKGNFVVAGGLISDGRAIIARGYRK